MAAALERQSLVKLCSGETYEKAQAILRLTKVKTGVGTGYLVAHPSALPGICAYLASEELNNNEVSQKAAVASACISQNDFTKALSIVRQALGSTAQQHTRDLDYRSLISTYHVAPAEEALDWMHEAESSIPKIMEVQGVQEKSLCQNHGVRLPAFKSVMKALDKECDAVAGRIKSELQEMKFSEAPSKLRTRPSTSPQKSPSKSAMKAKSRDVTPAKPLTLKRAVVAFSHSIDDPDDTLLPETPTKRRRVESPSKPSGSVLTPAKRTRAPQSATHSVTAFEQAVRGDSTPRHEQQKSAFPIAVSIGSHSSLPGPSTPRRSRNQPSRLVEESATMEVDEQRSAPAGPPVRKRFRPVFLDQRQWCSRDPKLAKIWDAAIEHRTRMMGLYPHPFEQYRPVVTS
ncbi:uncharacterized protein F5891DRAFT_1033865 [Suillus fuscotomentosus]|uniref:Uncharacterized protein n=1 Tax=Suillus fuscotomentosus TaxID=1912939 RepID=A0AAD4E658_9AGAM|nr:uncharacterized protein F5891DRAFT_1033865 [Suillus fuscotomentosus]KAG1900399.1 hypothetical protein F5891DRAFT_1033865 [Suillus fuscotomentosus]